MKVPLFIGGDLVERDMTYSLNSLKGIILGSIFGLIKGDTSSLDYSSYMSPEARSMLRPKV